MDERLSQIIKQGLNGAIISEDEKYRYALWRIWDEDKPTVMFIMLNPSTADATKNDATINKCVAYAKRWGLYGGIFVCNLYALRSRDPGLLKFDQDPIGPDCDKWLITVSAMCTMKIAAWGNKILSQGRVFRVKTIVSPLNCLEKSKAGNPKHPLYLRKNLTPRFF